MSLKENMDMIKEELNSEEKFFEKAVITEKFVKKYKKPMIAIVVAVVVFVGANIAYDIHKQGKITDANNALALLSKDAKNSGALLTLKGVAPNLYDVWIYSVATATDDMVTMKELKNSKAELIGDLATYDLAKSSQDIDALDSYASKQSSIYKDLALVQSAIILMGKNEIKKSHEILARIQPNSSMSKIASALMHYGIE